MNRILAVLEVLNLKFKLSDKGTARRGQISNLGAWVFGFVGLIIGAFFIMVYLFVGQTLNTSLNNALIGQFWTNVVTSTNNFGSQLTTVGTIVGVMLLIVVIGGAAFAYLGRRGGGGSGM